MKRKPQYTDYTRLVWAETQLALVIREVRKAGAVKTLARLRAARSSLKGALRHAANWKSRAERHSKMEGGE